jgi:RimJ/RimL family protein N-acetyltransferase
MRLVFKHLSEIDINEIVALNSNPTVHRHMPLAEEDYDEEKARAWVSSKERQWEEHGYGPWAFEIDGRFAGWGGLQYEKGDADLALVLHPDFWGFGKMIFDAILEYAFGKMGLKSVTIQLPPSRHHDRIVERLGFLPDGEVEVYGKRFLQYRLLSPGSRDLD